MDSIVELSGSHLQTYNAIFQHPVSHNLEWRKVHSLLQRIGVVTTEPNGHLKVVRNGRTLVLHVSMKKDVSEVSEVMELRHFQQRSNEAAGAPPLVRVQWLLLIDHHQARIFRCDTVGAEAEEINPTRSAEFFRYPAGSKDFSRGKEKPDAKTYFGAIGDSLRPPGQILVFGRGTGTSSEMDEFVAWARAHRPILASQIVGTQVVDSQHQTDGQLLALARATLAAGRARGLG